MTDLTGALIKTCTTCAHYGNSTWPAVCRVVRATQFNYVDGTADNTYDNRMCREHRRRGWLMARLRLMCGKEGRYWEGKQ